MLDGDRAVFIGDVSVRKLRCGVTRTVLDRAPHTEIARDHGCHPRTLGCWVARIAAIAQPAQLARVLAAAPCAPVLPELPVSRPSRSARLVALRNTTRRGRRDC